jgi:large subunit ribosomal protein L27Ae
MLQEKTKNKKTKTNTNKQTKKTEAAPILDVVQSGYYKVLGNRRFPKRSVFLKAKLFSRRAEEKMNGVGDACVLVAWKC